LDAASKPDISVFRSSANGTTRLTLDADSELQPGDVVEVALRGEDADIAARSAARFP
jgi:polysaccharide export outer membrane protein